MKRVYREGRWGRVVLGCGLAVWSAGCGSQSDAAPTTADLPEGWSSAKPIDDFTQTTCEVGQSLVDERLEVTPGSGSLTARYLGGQFICGHPVQGFIRESAEAADVLVQPIEMNPTSAVLCSCTSQIIITVKPLAPGPRDVTLYRRGDSMSGPEEPVLVGTDTALVE